MDRLRASLEETDSAKQGCSRRMSFGRIPERGSVERWSMRACDDALKPSTLQRSLLMQILQDRLSACVDAELFKDVLHMPMHGPNADVKRLGDLLVESAF